MNRTTKILIFLVIPISLLVFILVIIFPAKRVQQSKPLPVPTKEPQSLELIRPGIINEESSATKNSQSQIEKIRNQLPFTSDFRTSTGDTVRVGVIHFSLDPPSLLRIVLGGNINLETNRSTEELKADLQFPKQLQNFRESSQFAFEFIDSHGADHAQIMIDWGSDIANRNAQDWFVPSNNFPEVIIVGKNYEFKK